LNGSRLPEKNLVTPQQAALEAVKWLERLEQGEISSVTRRDLEVELTHIQIEQRIRKYGDFTRLNNLRDEIQKQGFDIYSDDERGDFTLIEAREL
jgi:hypothetical protein